MLGTSFGLSNGCHCMAVRGFDRTKNQVLCTNNYGPEGKPGVANSEPLVYVKRSDIKFFAHIQVEQIVNDDK
jgi:hypothetical protein